MTDRTMSHHKIFGGVPYHILFKKIECMNVRRNRGQRQNPKVKQLKHRRVEFL
jgi:hypothetical protein